jgi:RNA polymerase sigma factor (sigma-70 family)
MLIQEDNIHGDDCTCDDCLLAQMRSIDAGHRKRGWQAWYERDAATLFGYVQHHCYELGCPEQSEDLVHDTFVVGFRNISSGKYAEQGKPLCAYLYGIAKNMLRKVRWLHNKEGIMLPEDDAAEPVAATADPVDRVMLGQVLTMIEEAYERLSALAQRVITGLYANGKSSKELAAQLKKSAGAVRNIASRSIEDMKSYIAGRYDLQISSDAIRSCLEELWQPVAYAH